MGPKKGRPRKNSSVENSNTSDKSKDSSSAPKAPRGRPAKKKLILAPSTSTECTLPSIENVPAVRKSARGRGRKKVHLGREVLCSSNNDMQLRSHNSCNSGNLQRDSKRDADSTGGSCPPVEGGPGCNPQEDAHAGEEISDPDKLPPVDSSESNEDKICKENSLSAKYSPSVPSPPPQRSDAKQTGEPQHPAPSEAPQDEPPVPAAPFSPGDVPLKKRRLRDLVVRDREGFVASASMTTFVSPTSSGPSTPQPEVQLETPKKIVGAHVLFSGGYEQALYKAKSCEYTALGIFVKDLRTWVESKVISEEDVTLFQKALKECGFGDTASIVARGSYIVGVCSSDPAVLRASTECIVDDLERCSRLDLPFYTIQLGEYGPSDTREACIRRVADTLDRIHSLTSSVVTVLENTCGEENTVGGSLDDLKAIFDGIRDKSRMGFALDTCHLFSSGVDLRKKEVFDALIKEFEEKIGLQYLKVIYVNDCGGDLESHVDQHLSIGQGKIGLEFFELLMNDPNFVKVPLILETPISMHEFDFKTLNSLVH